MLHDTKTSGIVDLLRDATVVASLESERIVVWNPAATALLGYAANEALELPFEALVSEALGDLLRPRLRAIREASPLLDAVVVVEGLARRKNGAHVQVELTLSPLDVPAFGGRCVLAVFRDIAERLRAEQDRLRTARLEGALLAARTIEHHLGNDLAPVVGYSEMLAFHPDLPADMRAWTNEIQQRAAGAMSSLRRMRELRRLEESDVGGPDGPLIDIDRSTA